MNELQQILELLGKHGWRPVLSGALLLLCWRLGRPEIVFGAVSRVYSDVRGAISVWWASRQDLLREEREARRAKAKRDRAIEAAYLALPEGAIPRSGPGASVRTTGEYSLGGLAVAAPEGGVHAGANSDPADSLRGCDDGCDRVRGRQGAGSKPD